MFFLPNAIFYGHPDFGVGMYIWKSMIPTTLGNIIGGGFFVATMYWYLYLTGLGSDEVRFDLGNLDAAMEAGGPMGRARPKQLSQSESDSKVSGGDVIEGKEPPVGTDVHQVPSTTTHMSSAIGQELNAETYAKPKSEAQIDGSEKV